MEKAFFTLWEIGFWDPSSAESAFNGLVTELPQGQQGEAVRAKNCEMSQHQGGNPQRTQDRTPHTHLS